jgi:WD40 repeat protein
METHFEWPDTFLAGLSPDRSRALLHTGQRYAIWGLQEEPRMRLAVEAIQGGKAVLAEFSQDGAYVVAATKDNQVMVIDAETGAVLHSWREDDKVKAVSVAPTLDLAAVQVSGASTGWGVDAIRLRDARSGTLVSRLPVDGEQIVAFSSDGHFLLTSPGTPGDGDWRGTESILWDVDSGAELLRIRGVARIIGGDRIIIRRRGSLAVRELRRERRSHAELERELGSLLPYRVVDGLLRVVAPESPAPPGPSR